MYYYFCSNYPSVIKLSGAYFSRIDSTPKRCEISNETFIEVCALSSANSNFCFLLNNEFLTNPPENVTVTDLKGAFMLYFKKHEYPREFKIIEQKKYPDLIATLFLDNGIRLSLETPEDFYGTTIKEEIVSAEIVRLDDPKIIVINAKTNKGEYFIQIYNVKHKITKIFEKTLNNVFIDKEVVITETFLDFKKHSVKTTLEIVNEEVRAKNVEISCLRNINLDKCRNEIIPYLFLEDFLVGESVDAYLGCGVKENADKLKHYLGNYFSIIPPPFFRAENEIGLVYKQTKNKYYVEYFSFEIEDKKIINLRKND